MINRDSFTDFGELCSPATDAQILDAQRRIGCKFPASYRDFLKLSNGIVFEQIESLRLYSTDELEERNQTYEVQEYLPGWLMIGDDGGGRGILIDCMQLEGPIYIAGHGALFRESARLLASSITEWSLKKFQLDE